MGLQPQIQKKAKFVLKKCSICGQSLGVDSFAPTKSPFYPDGAIPICNDCIDTILKQDDYSWNSIDKFCQMIDIPFIPEQWEQLKQMSPDNIFYRYANIFMQKEYEGLNWSQYNELYNELAAKGNLEDELPLLNADKRKQLQKKWGGNYDDEALTYLEDLLNGLLATQNISGKLQLDQALKICKMSYELDRRIAEGGDFDKLLTSYDKLVKTAEFTPKNSKNLNDFDTCGEMIKYMEKKGWRNNFYDDVTRDVVDETLKNIQAFNQRLYTEETGMADEIARRCEMLKTTTEMENYYQTDQKYDLDTFSDAGYNELMRGLEEDEFKVDLE